MSANIKERLDFSCALFDAAGGLVANAPHIPVHLGAMQARQQLYKSIADVLQRSMRQRHRVQTRAAERRRGDANLARTNPVAVGLRLCCCG